MRFKTEIEGLVYLTNKNFPDPRGLERKQPDKDIHCVIIARRKPDEIRADFNAWINVKRFMFSPEELIALRGYDHCGHKGTINQVYRDHVVNVFIDWAERKSRRFAYLVVLAAHKDSANIIMQQLNCPNALNTFGDIGYSAIGGGSPTHYICGRNCSASEYDYLEDMGEQGVWIIYDAQLYRGFDDFLSTLKLKLIEPEEVPLNGKKL